MRGGYHFVVKKMHVCTFIPLFNMGGDQKGQKDVLGVTVFRKFPLYDQDIPIT